MAACVGILGTQTGCVGLMANLVHAVGADKIPANYDGLKKSRVAIVTISDNSQYSDDLAARQLSRSVGEILLKEVDKLTLVREDEIEQWRDTNGRDNIDLLSIGQGVKADKVIGIELTNMRLREGKTLYQGRSDVSVSVIEVSHGGVVHTKQWEDFTYPVSSGQYTSETTEMKFQKLYLSILAKQIAREFYPYDMSETVALDAAIASQ
jgi:hypothetical protein